MHGATSTHRALTLPAPDRPTTATLSPGRMLSVTLSNAGAAASRYCSVTSVRRTAPRVVAMPPPPPLVAASCGRSLQAESRHSIGSRTGIGVSLEAASRGWYSWSGVARWPRPAPRSRGMRVSWHRRSTDTKPVSALVKLRNKKMSASGSVSAYLRAITNTRHRRAVARRWCQCHTHD